MSALAQYTRWMGIAVSGSDRSLYNTASASMYEKLSALGCILYEQDGSGISDRTDAVCISTAIEPDNPDIAAAVKLSIPILHRSDILSSIVKEHRAIAVAGTSGKSTVTAMIFEFLTSCGKSPSLISGAPLKRLQRESLIGNAFKGSSDLLVLEADESDGTIIKYEPYISIFLNLSKDHKSIDEIKDMFIKLAGKSAYSIRNADDPNLKDIPSTATFSLESPADWRPDFVKTGEEGGLLIRNSLEYRIPLPGLYNLSNCAAALSAAEALGCSPQCLQSATSLFEGVERRFTITNTNKGVVIIDDFAHNPEKIRAAVTASRLLSSRIIAIYQPHGFGPTRFLRNEYRELFKTLFTENEILCLLPIYYAGGTVVKDISSVDLKNDLADVKFKVIAPAYRDEILPMLKEEARPGDCILVMGARDPTLPLYLRKIIDLFGSAARA